MSILKSLRRCFALLFLFCAISIPDYVMAMRGKSGGSWRKKDSQEGSFKGRGGSRRRRRNHNKNYQPKSTKDDIASENDDEKKDRDYKKEDTAPNPHIPSTIEGLEKLLEDSDFEDEPKNVLDEKQTLAEDRASKKSSKSGTAHHHAKAEDEDAISSAKKGEGKKSSVDTTKDSKKDKKGETEGGKSGEGAEESDGKSKKDESEKDDGKDKPKAGFFTHRKKIFFGTMGVGVLGLILYEYIQQQKNSRPTSGKPRF